MFGRFSDFKFGLTLLDSTGNKLNILGFLKKLKQRNVMKNVAVKEK